MARLGALGNVRPVPGHWVTDPTVDSPASGKTPVAKGGSAVEKYLTLAFQDAMRGGENPYESDAYKLLEKVRTNKTLLESEHARLASVFRRFDNLYHPEVFTRGGADHWAAEAPATAGKVHISVNLYRTYVDIPASLQATPPVENVLPIELTKAGRSEAALAERLYFKWLEEDDREVKDMIACKVKSLYGITFGKVYWDAVRKMPTLQIIENPENLYVGYGSDDYSRIDWTIFCYRISPQAVEEDWGLQVIPVSDGDKGMFPYVIPGDHSDPLGTLTPLYREQDNRSRRSDDYMKMWVEVYDYWYKKPKGAGKAPDIWNAIFVGNRMVENKKHPEYDGEIPYIPLPNDIIPGSPYGQSELHDIEQLLREKDERVSEQAQMLHSVVGGQRYQIVGPEAPEPGQVPAGVLPKPNEVSSAGPGNEIRPIQPFVPEFQIENYNQRIDSELEKASGLNSVMLGTVPTSALRSSKALTAIIANYESRINPKRKLFYRFRREVWRLAAKVWEAKDPNVKKIIAGHYRLEIKPPELSPRDELETAQMAINLVQNKVWSALRARDATGVEDPEDEANVIREERTDASMFPADVLQQIQLMAGIQSMQQQANPENQGQVAAAGASLAANARQSANAQRQQTPPAKASQSMNAAENKGNPPPSAQPSNTAEGAQGNGAGELTSQTLLGSNGLQGRILTSQTL